MQINIHNIQNQVVGNIDVPESVFMAPVREGLMLEMVNSQRATRRKGTHKTKNRGEVSGSGAKPFRQKGTGRARQGSSRSPIMVGGGVTFGPRPRDYSYRLPRSSRRTSLCSAISVRMREKNLIVLDKFELSNPKTKEIVNFLSTINSKSALIVDMKNEYLKLSTRNLEKTKFLLAEGLNVYDILNHEKLILIKNSLVRIIEKATGEISVKEVSE